MMCERRPPLQSLPVREAGARAYARRHAPRRPRPPPALRGVTGPAARLKSCVRCGAILQAADGLCPSCHASQPPPGAPREPPSPSRPQAGGARRPRGPALGAVALLVVVAGALALALTLVARRGGGAGQDSPRNPGGPGGSASGAAGSAAFTGDASRLDFAASETGGDAFDRVAGGGAPAIELDLQRVTETYPVEGATTAQIFAAIDAHGPDGPDGKAVGLTRMQNGAYRYARDERSGRCAIKSISARLTVTLPRLLTTSVPAPIYERWQEYARAVEEHEQHHVGIYGDAARRVVKRLGAEQPFADREAMQAGFKAAWEQEMDRAERENADFHRQEARGVAQERELLGNELQRVDQELSALAARQAARGGGRARTASEARQAEADSARYDVLLKQRAGLVERGLWLH